MPKPPLPNIKIISPLSELDFIGKGYYDFADESHFWMKWRFLAFIKQLKRNQIPLETYLKGFEIGCGHGVFRKQIEGNSNWAIDGADLDLNSLKSNPAGKGDLYLYNIFEKQKSFENKYDFVCLFDVIEHIEQDQQFLEAAAFHLKKGGLLFINVPALPALFSNYDTYMGHQRRYTKESLKDVLERSRLDVLDIQYWGLSLIPILFLRKAILKSCKDPQQSVQKGFAPPNPLVNQLLVCLMHVENFLTARPFLGTSLLAIARK